MRTSAFVLGLCLFVALSRLLELRHSSRNIRASAAGKHAADGPLGWGLMVLLHVGWLAGTLAELLHRGEPAPLIPFAVGLVALVLAFGLRWWSIRTLGGAWNARACVADDLRIVTWGPYRWIRHPNYLGVIVELAALPLLAGAWVTLVVAALLNAFVLRARMRGEEALLRAIPGYAEAMDARGGLLPRRSRGRGAASRRSAARHPARSQVLPGRPRMPPRWPDT